MPDQNPCNKHGTFNCICQQARDRRTALLVVKKDLKPYTNQRNVRPISEQKKSVKKKVVSKSNVMVKKDKMLYARELPKPLYKMIESDYDDHWVE